MKKVLFFSLLASLAIMISSFKPSLKTDYGPWQRISCYGGIEFCTKRVSNEPPMYEWKVKIRNNYRTTVNFGFEIKEGSVNATRTTNRTTIKAGEVFETYQYLYDANNVKLFLDKLRFGDDYGKYAPCDIH